jgi:hypothetical protein
MAASTPSTAFDPHTPKRRVFSTTGATAITTTRPTAGKPTRSKPGIRPSGSSSPITRRSSAGPSPGRQYRSAEQGPQVPRGAADRGRGGGAAAAVLGEGADRNPEPGPDCGHVPDRVADQRGASAPADRREPGGRHAEGAPRQGRQVPDGRPGRRAIDTVARWMDRRREFGFRKGPLFCTLAGTAMSDRYVRNML